MDKRTIIDKPSVGKTESYLLFSDLHSFDCDIKGVQKFLDLFKKNVPKVRRNIILNGDIIDVPYLSTHDSRFKSLLKAQAFEDHFIPEMDAEIDWYNDLIEKLGEYVTDYNKIFITLGNHEERCTRPGFINKTPHMYRPSFDLEYRLHVKKRGIPFIDYNDYFLMKANRSANLEITHGTHCGTTHLKRHFDDVHTSIIYGHTHQAAMQTFKGTPTCTVYNNPCLSNLDPSYMGGRINNWAKGASFINRTRDHIFVNICQMQDNEILDQYGNRV